MALSLSACGGSSDTATTTEAADTTPVSSNFTSDIDNLVGGAGADTFIGDANTTSEADQVAGGDGADTLKLYGGAALPTISGVESLYIKDQAGDLDVSEVTGLTSVELDEFSLAAARDVNLTTGASLTLTDTTGTANTITLSNNTATAQTINVSGSGDATNAIDFDLDGDAVATLNLVSGAKASFVDVDNTGASLATVNVSGAGDLTIEDVEVATAINITPTGKTVVDTAVAKVVVTGGAGEKTVTLDHATGTAREFSVSTGAGDDKIDLGAMVAAADLTDDKITISGGEGTDTLAMKSAMGHVFSDLSAAAFAKKGIANDFEVLEITDQAGAADPVGIARIGNNITTVDYAAGLGNAGQTLTGLASGGTVVLGAAAAGGSNKLAVTVLDADAAGAISDVLNVTLDSVHAGGTKVLGILQAAAVETVNINSTSTKATDLVAADKNDLNLIVADATTVNITGNVYLDLGNDALDGGVQVVDASANTAGVDIAIDSNTAVAITGTAKADTLTGGAGADAITAGAGDDVIVGAAGADIIDGGAGVDTITGGVGADTITTGAGADNVVISSGLTMDTVKDFTVGTGGDRARSRYQCP
ncbi:hypothetical protein [Nereida sp. NH-UV-3]|uniref:hypothetical protein n=1 Tax=Nereida TaxID=282198 RepID=UPI0036F2C23E